MKPHIAYDYSNHAAILVWSPWILCDIILYEIEHGNMNPLRLPMWGVHAFIATKPRQS